VNLISTTLAFFIIFTSNSFAEKNDATDTKTCTLQSKVANSIVFLENRVLDLEDRVLDLESTVLALESRMLTHKKGNIHWLMKRKNLYHCESGLCQDM